MNVQSRVTHSTVQNFVSGGGHTKTEMIAHASVKHASKVCGAGAPPVLSCN